MKAAEPAARRRSYRMQRRLEKQEETRERIVRAAFELHREVGPAYATIRAVAERAGVERHTVYRHFPEVVSLFQACTLHGMATTGLPGPEEWLSISDPLARLRAALTAMYVYWRRNEQLVANILRDMPVTPPLVEGSRPYQDHLGEIWHSVLEPFGGIEGTRGEAVRALAGTALEFGTWQSLARRYGLPDAAAVDAMVTAVRSAVEAAKVGRAAERDKIVPRPRSSVDRARPS